MQDSCYQQAVKRGVTRRDFLKLCTATAAMLGLEATAVPKIINALETNPPVSVIYLNLQECTCCSESFIRSGHPLTSELILDLITLEYMDVLQAGAGLLAENAREKVIHKGGYLLIVEGSIPTAADGVYCTIGGRTCEDILKETAEGAIAVISYGTCATDGCVQGAAPNPTKAQPVHKILANDPILKDKPVIKVPGCPPISEVITGTIVQYLTFGEIPELTPDGRPKAFYSHTIHETCNRRAFFDMGLFVHDFDDEGARQGWCLFLMGCRGPLTKNACAITGWNEGTSYPIKSGHPCLGCSEDHFYDRGPFYTSIKIPETSVPEDYTAQKVVAAAGVSLAVGGALGTIVGTSLLDAYKKKKAASAEDDDESSGTDESGPKNTDDNGILCK